MLEEEVTLFSHRDKLMALVVDRELWNGSSSSTFNRYSDISLFCHDISEELHLFKEALKEYVLREPDKERRSEVIGLLINSFSIEGKTLPLHNGEEEFAFLKKAVTPSKLKKESIAEFIKWQEHYCSELKKYLLSYLDGAIRKFHEMPKIPWKGTAKQLAELFVILNNKGWIEFPKGDRAEISKTIQLFFDLRQNMDSALRNAESASIQKNPNFFSVIGSISDYKKTLLDD